MLTRDTIAMVLGLFLSVPLLQAGEESGKSLLVAPVVASGDLLEDRHFLTTFRIVNLVDRQIILRIEGLNDEGAVEQLFCPGPVVGGPERTLMLPANGAINLGSGGSVFSGWGRITAEDSLRETVQISTEISVVEGDSEPCPPVICTVPSQGVFSSIQSSTVEPAQRFRSQATIASQRESAFAIVNPSTTEEAQVQVLVRDPSGDIFDTNELILEPGRRVSLLLWQLLLLNKQFLVEPQRPDNFHGTLEVKSDLPVAVGGVQLLLPEGKLVNLPVQAVPPLDPISESSQ